MSIEQFPPDATKNAGVTRSFHVAQYSLGCAAATSVFANVSMLDCADPSSFEVSALLLLTLTLTSNHNLCCLGITTDQCSVCSFERLGLCHLVSI